MNVSGEGIVTYSDGNSPCSMTACKTDELPHRLVFLTAVAAQGYTFKGWTQGCVGTGAVCGVTPAQAPVVSAEFVHAGAFQLTVSGPGVVRGDGGEINCGMGDNNCSDTLSGSGTTQFTATGAPGSVFLGWGGACAQFATGPCAVANSAFSGATAAFAPAVRPLSSQSLTVNHPLLTVASAPDSLNSCLAAPSCTASIPGGSSYTLVAGGSFINNPFSAAVGVSWTGGCVGSWPVCSVVVDGPTAINVRPIVTPHSRHGQGPAPVTLVVEVTGRGRLRAVRGTLSSGCGATAAGGSYQCTLTEAAGGFELRAIPIGHNKFRKWHSSMYPLCKPATRADCAANVSYEGPDLAANFSGG